MWKTCAKNALKMKSVDAGITLFFRVNFQQFFLNGSKNQFFFAKLMKKTTLQK